MIDTSAAGRVGTTDKIAPAPAYLVGADAGFIRSEARLRCRQKLRAHPSRSY